jgi:hypothetical protein
MCGLAVMQVAWTNKLSDQVMPYMIQFMKDYSSKVDLLMQERKEAQQARVQVTPCHPVKTRCLLRGHYWRLARSIVCIPTCSDVFLKHVLRRSFVHCVLDSQ